MALLAKHILLKQLSIPREGEGEYQVIETRNTITFHVGQILKREDLIRLGVRGINFTIKSK